MKSQALAKILAAGMLIAACGGTQTTDGGGETPGQSHSTASHQGGETDGTDEHDMDAPLRHGNDGHQPASSDAGAQNVSEVPVSDAPVTFVLRNSGDEPLFLNMDKGWQAVIYAYSGTPPNAKSILMFPTHCTTSCDADAADVCPVCEEPQRVKDIKAAENHDEVAPGDARTVPWDGMVFNYQKTKGTRDGRRVRCNCSTTAEPPAETYTIKACGLRKTQSAKTRSKYQCVESTLTLPITEPVQVELDFGA